MAFLSASLAGRPSGQSRSFPALNAPGFCNREHPPGGIVEVMAKTIKDRAPAPASAEEPLEQRS